MSRIVLALVVLGARFLIRWLRPRALIRSQQEDIERALPDAVDLLRLATLTGFSVHQVVGEVLPSLPAPIAPAFAEVQRRVDCGLRLGDALDALEALGEAAHPLLAVVRSTAFDGTPLLPALERVAADSRMIRRRRAEQMARRLPVLLLLPLVLCVLPAFALLAVVPLIAASLGALSL
jgi:tight adherence protein C